MGKSNEIQDTNMEIVGKTCQECQQVFTEKDKENDNWEAWWDTTNGVELIEPKNPDGYYEVKSMFIRFFTHKLITTTRIINDKPRTEEEQSYTDCPYLERCQGCCGKFLEDKVKEFDDHYYCETCYKEITSNRLENNEK